MDAIVGAPGRAHVVPEIVLEFDESPTTLVARSITLYDVLSDKLVTTIGELVVDASMNPPPFNEYLYVVIAVPPFDAGAENTILICLFPPVTDEIVGAPG